MSFHDPYAEEEWRNEDWIDAWGGPLLVMLVFSVVMLWFFGAF